RGRHAGLRLRSIGKPEERERVAIADIEEEMLTAAARQIERLDQRHAEHVRVEVHRARHVLAHQREMIDSADIEYLVFDLRHWQTPFVSKLGLIIFDASILYRNLSNFLRTISRKGMKRCPD